MRLIRNAGIAAGVGVLLSACGSASVTKPAAEVAQVVTDAGGQPLAERVVPAEALTSYEQAVAVMASGDYLEAQLRLQEFLLQYPDFPGAHVNLAIIYANNADEQGAENSLTDALLIDPEYAPALNQLGMLLRRQGKFGGAESVYLRAIESTPEYALPYYNLGVLNELYLQRLDVALQYYEQYQLLKGDDKQVQRWIADLKRRIGADRRTANVTE